MSSIVFQEAAQVLNEIADSGPGPVVTTRSADVFSLTPITASLVEEVIVETRQDPILKLGQSLDDLKSVNVEELTDKLQVLNTCIPSKGLFTAATREKAWGNFCAMQCDVADSLLSLIRRPLASFITLSCMEKLLLINFPPPTNTNAVIDELSVAEKDIVIYVGGFILFKCKKNLSSKYENVIKCLIKEEGAEFSSVLVQCKNRGGLCEPVDDMIKFFMLCEILYKNEASSFEQHNVQLFVNAICARSDILSLFYKTSYGSDVTSEAQEAVLFNILSNFYHLRCHAKCRQFMEKFFLKSKTLKKQKALRKAIGSDN